MAFFTPKNGPRGATVSETFLLALEIMLKTAPSAPTFSVGASKRPPRGSQEGPKGAPRGSKRPPRGLQDAPKGLQDAARRGSSGSRESAMSFKIAHGALGGFLEATKRVPRGFRRPQEAAKRPPRGPQEVPRAFQEASKRPLRGSKRA